MDSDLDTQQISGSGLNPFQAMSQQARAWVYFAYTVLGLAMFYLSSKGIWGIGKDELEVWTALSPFVGLTALSNVKAGPA